MVNRVGKANIDIILGVILTPNNKPSIRIATRQAANHGEANRLVGTPLGVNAPCVISTTELSLLGHGLPNLDG